MNPNPRLDISRPATAAANGAHGCRALQDPPHSDPTAA